MSTNERLTRGASRVFPSSRFSLAAVWRAIRPQRWITNLIVFVPILIAHKITDLHGLARGLLAFVAFCLCASAVYILNDVAGLEADRRDATKTRNPFASGELFLPYGLFGFPLLVLISVALGWWLSREFVAVLGGYALLATGCSWPWKKIPLLRLFCLAVLLAARLLAGYATLK